MAQQRANGSALKFVPTPYIAAGRPDKIPYFVDAPAGQKSSTQTYPQPLLWVLSEPYFVDARPYIIPSEPYIVPSMPYIVAKSIRQLSESIAVRVPKTPIKLRKPIKTPAGALSILVLKDSHTTRCASLRRRACINGQCSEFLDRDHPILVKET